MGSKVIPKASYGQTEDRPCCRCDRPRGRLDRVRKAGERMGEVAYRNVKHLKLRSSKLFMTFFNHVNIAVNQKPQFSLSLQP